MYWRCMSAVGLLFGRNSANGIELLGVEDSMEQKIGERDAVVVLLVGDEL